MAAPSKTSQFQRFRATGDWTSPCVLYAGGHNLKELMVHIRIKTVSKLGIGDYADLVETAGDDTDLMIATQPADNSIVPMLYIIDSENNRKQLLEDNKSASVLSYTDLTRNTATFAAYSTSLKTVEAIIIMPGMILNSKFADSTTVKPGVKVSNAGSRKLDVGTTTLADIGSILDQFVSEAAVHNAAVRIGL